MRILQIHRTDGGNGAANAAYRLHREFLRLGHDARLMVTMDQTQVEDRTVKPFEPPTDLLSKVRRRLRNMQIQRSFAPYRSTRPAGREAFSHDRTAHGADLLPQLPPCDVIQIHSMYMFADYQTFFATVPRHTPVVRMLHDMNIFTGGCHSNEWCPRFTERCGACPQLGSQDPEDLSHQIWQRKYAAHKAIPAGRLHVVTPSRWLAAEAQRSSLLQGIPISVIPHGVDTEVFCPRDRGFARDLLGIPRDANVVLFVAEPIDRRIKGFSVLAQALEGLRDLPNLLLVSVGSGKPPAEIRIPYFSTGMIRDERLLSLAYSAADIFAISSLQENFPLTVLEALACGTPVVGSAVGGIPEMVRPGLTGELVPAQDATALGAALRALLQDHPRRAAMAANCRRIATEEYSLKLQGQRYVDLFRMIVDAR